MDLDPELIIPYPDLDKELIIPYPDLDPELIIPYPDTIFQIFRLKEVLHVLFLVTAPGQKAGLGNRSFALFQKSDKA